MRGSRAGIALCVLACASSAAADRTGVITIVGADAPVDRKRLEKAAGAVGGDVAPEALATAALNLRTGAVPRTRLERFAQVRAAAEQGWQSFLEVQAAFAQSRLAKARSDAEELLPLAGGVELYADISLRLGAVLDYLGRKQEGGEAIRIALALDPGRELTEREFSPDVLGAVTAARAVTPPVRSVRLAATTPGRVTVALEVDGAARGNAPLALDLPLGTHVVVARAPGHTPRAVAFSLDPAGSDRVTIDLDVDQDAAAIAYGLPAGAPDARATATVEAALRYGEVDAVVLVAPVWLNEREALLLQRCSGTPVRCTAIVELGYGKGSLADALRAGLRDVAGEPARLAAATVASDPRVGLDRAGGRCRICRNPWFWAGVGAAVIAATAITIVATDEDPTVPEIVFDPTSVFP